MAHLGSNLSDINGPVSWSDHPTSAFQKQSDALAILPIYGMSDHGLGLSLDLEEVVGSAVLRASATRFEATELRILPPLRADLSPYRFSPVSIDPDTLLESIQEIAAGVKRAGYSQLVFWTSSPWNSELIDVASRDIHIALDLHTYIIELSGIGLSVHPRSKDRSRVQSLATGLTGTPPTQVKSGTPADLNFRPGNWSEIPAVDQTNTASPEAIYSESANALTVLLREILARHWASRSENTPLDSKDTPLPNSIYPSERRTRYLPAQSTESVRQMADKAEKLIIIPVGAIEQHGPHLPVGVDAMIAEAAAAGLTARLPNDVIVAPSMCFGKSNEHEDFPGTLSLSARTLRSFLKSQVTALHQVGFRQFAFLNTHGGNSSVLTYTLRELQADLKIRAGMLRLPSTPELPPHEAAWGFHAGEWETSVMLAIAPDTVNMDRAICHYPVTEDAEGQVRPENAPAIFSWKSQDIAPDGVMGDATKATAEKGERWLTAALDVVAAQIRDLLQRA